MKTFYQDNNLSFDAIANELLAFKQKNNLCYDTLIEVKNTDGYLIYDEISVSDLMQELDSQIYQH